MHGMLATYMYAKDTYHNMSVMKLTFEIQENMLIPNVSFETEYSAKFIISMYL